MARSTMINRKRRQRRAYWPFKSQYATRTLIATSMMLIASCGFNLRGTAETLPATFPTLNVECQQKSAWQLCHYLNSRITSLGTVIDADAEIVLKVNREDSDSRVFALNTDATAAERELTHEIHYQLLDSNTGTMIAERTIARSQIYRHNASALVAKDREKAELEKSLDEALIDTMLRELAILSRD